MPSEYVCPDHGPYDASYGTCPYCSAEAGGRPQAPAPLDEDDLPTDLGPGAVPAGYDDDAPTEIGPGRQGPGCLDLDEEETELGRGRLMDDETELAFVEPGTMAILWVKEGHRVGKIFKIKEGTVVGRKDGDLILDDPKTSNPHAKFTVEDEQYVIWDFGSKNGTFVNGERIRAATPLNENDEVKIGDTLFVVKLLT